jgi:hypothetical protein
MQRDVKTVVLEPSLREQSRTLFVLSVLLVNTTMHLLRQIASSAKSVDSRMTWDRLYVRLVQTELFPLALEHLSALLALLGKLLLDSMRTFSVTVVHLESTQTSLDFPNVSSVPLGRSLTNWVPLPALYVQKVLFKTKKELCFVKAALLEDFLTNAVPLHVIPALEVLSTLLKHNLCARHVHWEDLQTTQGLLNV